MREELSKFYDPENGFYRFASLKEAMPYVDYMTDEDQVVIEDRTDSNFLARIQRVFDR